MEYLDLIKKYRKHKLINFRWGIHKLKLKIYILITSIIERWYQ